MGTSRSVVVAGAVSLGVLSCTALSGVALVNASGSGVQERSGDVVIAAAGPVGSSVPLPLPASSGLPSVPAVPAVPEAPAVPVAVPVANVDSTVVPVAASSPVASVSKGSGRGEGAVTQSRPTHSQRPAAVPAPVPSATPVAVTPSVRPSVSKAFAAQVVQRSTPGEVVSVERVTRAGFEAWAVTVARPDGSVVTGFVDVASGTVFDWVMVKAAPQVPAAGSSGDSGRGGSGSGSGTPAAAPSSSRQETEDSHESGEREDAQEPQERPEPQEPQEVEEHEFESEFDDD